MVTYPLAVGQHYLFGSGIQCQTTLRFAIVAAMTSLSVIR
jgi:hypothetical protein